MIKNNCVFVVNYLGKCNAGFMPIFTNGKYRV